MKKPRVNRRRFLTRAAGAVAGVAAFATPGATAAQTPPPPRPREGLPPMPPALETERPPEIETLTTDRNGADCMTDVIKTFGFEFICSNPGSSFRALHESILNYGANRAPELITCCHEESAVAIAHGYAKIDGRPIGVLAHGTVG